MWQNIEFLIGGLLLLAAAARLLVPKVRGKETNAKEADELNRPAFGFAQTRGSREVQADFGDAVQTKAGVLALLADGMGKSNTGKLCAQVAADTVLDAYMSYEVLPNPDYFFRISLREANLRIQKLIGERRAGAGLAAAFLSEGLLHYCVAGDVRLALFRNKELIPLSEGQTVDVLAVKAFEKGKMSRKEAIWCMDEKRQWNYLGMDGFHEIEFPLAPIRLKPGDRIIMATKGIWQELPWGAQEDIFCEQRTLQETAARLISSAEANPGEDKENGTVLVLGAETAGKSGE